MCHCQERKTRLKEGQAVAPNVQGDARLGELRELDFQMWARRLVCS